MSTQPESDDLDRTDELPRLDVVAYEASQGMTGAESLSRTDTWTVEALRDLESPGDSASPEGDAPTRIRPRNPLIAGSADLSVNVDRLLQRIAELESGVAIARSENTELESRCQSLAADRAAFEVRIRAVETDNARLGEQRTISQELANRLEEQLREQAEQHRAQLADMDTAREAERSSAERNRLAMEQRLEQSTASFTSTADQQKKLKLALEESMALAADRARQIDELQRTLAEEEHEAHALGRNLAAKLADYEIVSAMVAQRNATIVSLERTRDSLEEQLQQSNTQSGTLTEQLEQLRRQLAESPRYEREIADRDAQLAQSTAEVERLAHERSAMEVALRDAVERVGVEQQRHQSLTGEFGRAQQQLQSLGEERDQLLAAREQLELKTAELDRVSTELANVQRDAAEIWSELQTQSNLAHTRQQELASAEQRLGEMQRHHEALQQTLEEAYRNIERLHAVSGDDSQLLNSRSAELAALRQELDRQLPAMHALEQAMHARETLIDDLRAEIRTAQDERAIMADQLGKSRARVKSMAQQIFNRDNRIATLKADLAVHTEALASIRRDVDRVEGGPQVEPEDPVERVLEPVDHEGDPIVLNRRVMTIGRTNENDIFIPSKMISRHHARLLIGPNAVIVEDAGSTNGCFVNDQQIKQHVLHEGDVLAIGDLKFRLSIRSPNDTRERSNVIDFGESYRNPD